MISTASTSSEIIEVNTLTAISWENVFCYSCYFLSDILFFMFMQYISLLFIGMLIVMSVRGFLTNLMKVLAFFFFFYGSNYHFLLYLLRPLTVLLFCHLSFFFNLLIYIFNHYSTIFCTWENDVCSMLTAYFT